MLKIETAMFVTGLALIMVGACVWLQLVDVMIGQ
jgi:hypothetical protein